MARHAELFHTPFIEQISTQGVGGRAGVGVWRSSQRQAGTFLCPNVLDFFPQTQHSESGEYGLVPGPPSRVDLSEEEQLTEQ